MMILPELASILKADFELEGFRKLLGHRQKLSVEVIAVGPASLVILDCHLEGGSWLTVIKTGTQHSSK